MITPTKGPGSAAAMFQAVSQQAVSNKSSRPQQADAQFDQVKISRPSRGSQFQKELVARLVGEVRTAHTTGDIQRVKQDIQDGTYKIDANEIAARMLLEGGF